MTVLPAAVRESSVWVAGVRCLQMVPASPSDRVLVFVHGFAATPGYYAMLLRTVARHGYRVLAPRVSRIGLGLLTGRRTAGHEAAEVAVVAEAVARSGATMVLGGHSRGGQVVWLAAPTLPAVDGVVAVDPVDGRGVRPQMRTATTERFGYEGPVTIIGAALAARCAPRPVNHEAFVASAGRPVRHEVLDMGHVDMCDPWPRRFGRIVCRGSSRADAARRRVAELLVEALDSPAPPD